MSRARYAVFGHPVAHSRSPQIHGAFAGQFGIDLDYVRIDAAPDGFAAALARFGREGGRGANVTLPHKAAAAALCASLSTRAARAGAVNTLVRLDDASDGAVRWQGDNTDGIGLVRDLRDRHGLALDAANVLLVGAGGAAAGVVPALLDAGIATLVIANRSAERAIALADRSADPRVHGTGWDGLHRHPDTAAPPPASSAGGAGAAEAWGVAAATATDARANRAGREPATATPATREAGAGPAPALTSAVDAAGGREAADAARAKPAGRRAVGAIAFDLVINTTSAARGDEGIAWPWPPGLAPDWTAVDLGYGAAAASFLEAARRRGARQRVDGLGMLVEQAAESFRLWHGMAPETAPVYAALRRELPAP